VRVEFRVQGSGLLYVSTGVQIAVGAFETSLSIDQNFPPVTSMTKCKGPHHDFDEFTTYDFTTFTTERLLINLETQFCTVNPVYRSITSRKVVKVVRS